MVIYCFVFVFCNELVGLASGFQEPYAANIQGPRILEAETTGFFAAQRGWFCKHRTNFGDIPSWGDFAGLPKQLFCKISPKNISDSSRLVPSFIPIFSLRGRRSSTSARRERLRPWRPPSDAERPLPLPLRIHRRQ